jgi:hypothetical protein
LKERGLKMSDPEHCNGCTVLQDYEQCHILLIGKGDDCPCGTCLIKMICRDGMCQDSLDYMDSIKWGNENE